MAKRRKVTVIGLTRFGREIALRLAQAGAEVIALDNNPAEVQDISDQVAHAAIVDARNQKSLIELEVDKSDIAVIGIRDNLEMSVLILLALKEIAVPHIIALASGEDSAKVLERMGADKIIFPERDIARREAELILHPGMTGYMALADEYSMIEIGPPRDWAGHTILDLDVRRKFGVNVVAVRKAGNEAVKLSMPGPDYTIGPDDLLLILGPSKRIETLAREVA